MGKSLKNTMVQSFHRLSSSMSMVMGVSDSNPPRAAGRSGTGTARGRSNMAKRGAGRATGKQPVKGPGRSVDNKGKKQRQGKARNTGAVSRSN